MSDDINNMGGFSDILVSAHAPAVIRDLRLNIGSTDADFRATSVQVIIDYVSRAAGYPNVRQINLHFAPKRWHDDVQTVGRDGEYDLFIHGVREIAGFCERYDLELVLENNNAYWTDDIKTLLTKRLTGRIATSVSAWRRRTGIRPPSMSIATTWGYVSTPAMS